MTPEERAEQVWDEVENLPDSGIRFGIAAAIRAAVAEEREACAEIACRLQSQPGVELLRHVNCDHEEAGSAVAAAICARGRNEVKTCPVTP